METTIKNVVGLRSNGTEVTTYQLINSGNTVNLEKLHRTFTRSQKNKAKAEHLKLKRNKPFVFNEQRNNFLKAIIDIKEIKLNVTKIDLVV